MKALIAKLVEQADLSEEQAAKVATVVRDFIGDKLPEMLREPVLSALSGDNVDHGVDVARDVLGSLFK
jgi:uncharacterized protein with ATP-grasp and redox domains